MLVRVQVQAWCMYRHKVGIHVHVRYMCALPANINTTKQYYRSQNYLPTADPIYRNRPPDRSRRPSPSAHGQRPRSTSSFRPSHAFALLCTAPNCTQSSATCPAAPSFRLSSVRISNKHRRQEAVSFADRPLTSRKLRFGAADTNTPDHSFLMLVTGSLQMRRPPPPALSLSSTPWPWPAP